MFDNLWSRLSKIFRFIGWKVYSKKCLIHAQLFSTLFLFHDNNQYIIGLIDYKCINGVKQNNFTKSIISLSAFFVIGFLQIWKKAPNQIRLSVIDSIVQNLHLCTFTLSEHCKISEHAQKYRSVLGCNTKKDIFKCRFNRLIANVQYVCDKQFSKYFYCLEINMIYNTGDV